MVKPFVVDAAPAVTQRGQEGSILQASTPTTQAGPLPGSAPLRFAYGLSLPVRGALFVIRHPTLWPWVFVPILITTALILGAFGITWTWGSTAAAALLSQPQGSGWYVSLLTVGWHLMSALVHAVIFAATAVFGWFLGGILASPFYDRLSDQVERIRLGSSIDEAFDLKTTATDIAFGIRHSIAGLVLYAGSLLLVVPLQIIPGLGALAYLVLSTTISSFFLAREVLDYSLSRRRIGFRGKLSIVWTERALTGGLGLGTVMLLWIPLANFFSMPASVVGGTLLFCDLKAAGHLPGEAPSAGQDQVHDA